ncbi:Response regulator rcp1 [Andreprevotia sp. IGB-42]|uniref:response regulator n=1 Tax=Andreprevotia sp. IGB-42 TaxID=2497473 RepID=UPI00135A23AA|nr:response regulator [Andreprevotia sp. IGB-42]KAF0811610.1 Response regulator rcp1 [Andreprevotia sp. IGB-42]
MIGPQAILLVDDNDADAELTAMAFVEARIHNPVIRARDGVEALDYLFAQGAYAGRNVQDIPAIVLLDLNMPRLSGIDVLKAIRQDERIRHLPVIILTSSIEERDRMAAYENFANSYVQKPVDYDQFVTASRELGSYWLALNQPAPRKHV